MNTLGEPDENQSKSVDARQELDLRIGCAFTRFQTRFFQGKYGDLDSTLISYGPCQTPTLGFCVERHDQILTHKPETYWVLQVSVLAGNPSQKLSLDWERSRCFDRDVATMFLNLIKTENTAKIISVSKKEKQKEKPIALNTVELMRAASSGLGMGPSHAMSIAERLYMQGYISYPRTESTAYAENFDLKDVLRQQQNHVDWGADCKALLSGGTFCKPRKGHDAGDHPPITPCRVAGRGELDGDSFKLYDYIVRHFIGTVSPNCKYDQTTVKLDIAEEEFTYSGSKVTDPGFTEVMKWLAMPPEESIPEVKLLYFFNDISTYLVLFMLLFI
jgi:DNA topoisomerase-3